ncbi:hypothetical protein Tco_0001224 [Tanacetum coccineum]
MFISVFLNNQLKNVPVPLNHFPINALTPKVFSFMVKKGKSFSGNVTPLFPSMLAQPTEDEGAVLERPSETQPTPSPPHPSTDQHETQPDQSPRPSPTIPIPDSIPEGSGGNHGAAQIKDLKSQIKQLKKKAKPVISHHNAWIKSGRKFAKSTPTAHTDQIFDDVDVNDAMDYMETDAYMQKGVSTEDQVSTVKPDEGTVEPKDGTSYESTALTIVFRDDETIAEFLVSISQNKAKQKGVEIKDAEDSDRPRATSTRSVLTLKPLPKIDPKDKGKKPERCKSQRRFLAQQRGTAIRSRPPTRTQLKNQMMTYLKHVGGKKHADLKNKNFEEIQVLYKEVKRSDKNFIAIGSVEDERQIKETNEESKDPKKKRLKKRVANETPREEDTAKVPAEQEVTEQGTCHTPRRGLDGTRVRRRDLIDHLKYKA